MVYVSLSGNFEITRSEFVDLPEFSSKNLRPFSSVEEVPFVKDIDFILRRDLKEKLEAYSELVAVDAWEPYFVITYRNAGGSKITLTIVYNLVQQTVSVRNTAEVLLVQVTEPAKKVEEAKPKQTNENSELIGFQDLFPPRSQQPPQITTTVVTGGFF